MPIVKVINKKALVKEAVQNDYVASANRLLALYDAVVGSDLQLQNGVATHASLPDALISIANGDRILVLNGNYTGNISITKKCFIDGEGSDTVFTGNITLNSGSDYSTIRHIKIIGNLELNSNGNFITKCFQDSGTVFDTGSNNHCLIIQDNPPLPAFPNPGFEGGLSGWTVLNQRIFLNGGSTILGVPTPTDPTPYPLNGSGQASPGDGFSFSSGPTFSNQLVVDTPPSGGTQALELRSNGTFISPAGSRAIFYGPAAYSNDIVYARPGDTIVFSYKARGGDSGQFDAYNVYAYMVEPPTGRTLQILDANSTNAAADTGWLTVSKVVQPGEEGNYHFVFVNGSFDSTGGYVVGSTLIIDNINLIKV